MLRLPQAMTSTNILRILLYDVNVLSMAHYQRLLVGIWVYVGPNLNHIYKRITNSILEGMKDGHI